MPVDQPFARRIEQHRHLARLHGSSQHAEKPIPAFFPRDPLQRDLVDAVCSRQILIARMPVDQWFGLRSQLAEILRQQRRFATEDSQQLLVPFRAGQLVESLQINVVVVDVLGHDEAAGRHGDIASALGHFFENNRTGACVGGLNGRIGSCVAVTQNHNVGVVVPLDVVNGLNQPCIRKTD